MKTKELDRYIVETTCKRCSYYICGEFSAKELIGASDFYVKCDFCNIGKSKDMMEEAKNLVLLEVTLPQTNLFLLEGNKVDVSNVAGAFLIKRVLIDNRTVDDPKKIPAHYGTDGDWYDEGANHRVVNGQICRDTGYVLSYAVKIDSLNDLMELTKKYYSVRVGNSGLYNYIEL